MSDLGVHTCAHDGFIPENIFYRLAMKANSPVDPEDKDRRQITTQFGSKGVVKHDTPAGEQEMVIINESGLYSLVLFSKRQAAANYRTYRVIKLLPAPRRRPENRARQSSNKLILAGTEKAHRSAQSAPAGLLLLCKCIGVFRTYIKGCIKGKRRAAPVSKHCIWYPNCSKGKPLTPYKGNGAPHKQHAED